MVFRNRLSAVSAILGAALCGCTASNTPGAVNAAQSEPTPALTRDERIDLRREAREPKYVEQAPGDESGAVTGEVPDEMLDRVMADLEKRSGAVRSTFTVKRAESTQWSDGSLGCPEPGHEYTQALVNGYWIVIEHDGRYYDYRASDRGFFRLCPNPRSRFK